MAGKDQGMFSDAAMTGYPPQPHSNYSHPEATAPLAIDMQPQYGGHSAPPPSVINQQYGGYSAPPPSVKNQQYGGYSAPPPSVKNQQYGGYSAPPPSVKNQQYGGYSAPPPFVINQQYGGYNAPPPSMINQQYGGYNAPPPSVINQPYCAQPIVIAPMPVRETGPPPQTAASLIVSILLLILCLGAWPFAVVAIICNRKAFGLVRMGQYTEAKRTLRTTYIFIVITVILGIILWIIFAIRIKYALDAIDDDWDRYN